MTDDLAYGLSPIADYSTEMPFLNLMKQSRTWLKGWASAWEEIEPYIDENGWPTQMPPGWTVIRNFLALSAKTRSFVLTYEGEGTVNVGRASGGLSIEQAEAGRIEFTSPGDFEVNIDATDPNDNGEYIRNIRIVEARYEALADAGEIFNPQFLDIVGDARQIRFMDWMGTNGSTHAEWADRVPVDYFTYYGSYGMTETLGAPIEVMVALANRIGADPWFNIPHQASDDYVEQFADYLLANLDPDLVATVEYSNEVWNFAPGFGQTWWAGEQAAALWGTEEVGGIAPTNLDFQVMRATQIAKIMVDKFTLASRRDKLRNVLGLQNGNWWWLGQRMLNRLIWQTAATPAPVLNPLDYLDAVTVTSYFGGRTGLVAYLDEHTLDEAYDWMAANLLDLDYDDSIPRVVANWNLVKDVIDPLGLDLVLYEGGQHVAMGYDATGMTSEQIAKLDAFMSGFVRSPQMADLYAVLWDAWSDLPGDGPQMQYLAVGNGTWGLRLTLDDMSPRAALVMSRARGLSYQEGYAGVTMRAG